MVFNTELGIRSPSHHLRHSKGCRTKILQTECAARGELLFKHSFSHAVYHGLRENATIF
jgi:hypothetical protein